MGKTMFVGLVMVFLFCSCSPGQIPLPDDQSRVYTGIEGDVGPVSVGVSIDNYGQVTLETEIAVVSLGAKGLAAVSWTVGYEKTLNEAKQAKYNLFIVWQDVQDEVWQTRYDVGRPFKVTFSQQDWVRQINNDADGNIIVSVVHRIDSSRVDESSSRDIIPVSTCPGAAPQRVQVGDKVMVCTKEDHLIMRTDPNLSAVEIRRFDPGTEFKVLAGPECSDSSRWFFVKNDLTNKKGWVREGSDQKDLYFICTIQ